MDTFEEDYIEKEISFQVKELLEEANSFKEKQKKEKDFKGYVYFLKSKNEDIFKIGMTKDINRRFDQISPKLPFEVGIAYVFYTKDMFKLEKRLQMLRTTFDLWTNKMQKQRFLFFKN